MNVNDHVHTRQLKKKKLKNETNKQTLPCLKIIVRASRQKSQIVIHLLTGRRSIEIEGRSRRSKRMISASMRLHIYIYFFFLTSYNPLFASVTHQIIYLFYLFELSLIYYIYVLDSGISERFHYDF